ncbi:unnamed protein product [Caenorhabditis brenneri]
MELLKRRHELFEILKEKTSKLHFLQSALIRTCDVQKSSMEYCLEGIDDENDYKEEIEDCQLKFRYILNRHYYLMYNDGCRTWRETKQNKINSCILIDRMIELVHLKHLLHLENVEVEKHVVYLEKERGDLRKECDAMVKEINKLKDKIIDLNGELQKANISTVLFED